MPETSVRPVALVTGAGRRVGIAAGLCRGLADAGWDVALSYWTPYDDRQPWGRQPGDAEVIADDVRSRGARALALEADLEDPETPARLIDRVGSELGPVTALVMSHAESVDSSIRDTTVESFDRHFAVNARATWLLIKAFAEQVPTDGSGRILALTSDHTVHNLPYGASKGALDRIVLAAARELEDLRVTANVISPGPIDTGWMPPGMAEQVARSTPRGRIGTPADTAALVAFLCSEAGGWINGQLLYSNGGWTA